MAEELLVRNEPGHGDQTPATDRLKTRVDGIQIRHAVGGVHQRQPVTKLAARIRLQELRLPRIEPTPQRVILVRSEEHTSELQSLMRISYAVFCLKKKNIP